MRKTLVVVATNCTGCRRCEMWCSMKHKKVINTERSAIHVLRREPSIDIPLVCLQCGNCLGACPKDAIQRNKKTGAIEIKLDLCTGCGFCLTACPYGLITMDKVDKHAIKCDLCGGDPECVKHCKEDAILYLDLERAASYKREEAAKFQQKKVRDTY